MVHRTRTGKTLYHVPWNSAKESSLTAEKTLNFTEAGFQLIYFTNIFNDILCARLD